MATQNPQNSTPNDVSMQMHKGALVAVAGPKLTKYAFRLKTKMGILLRQINHSDDREEMAVLKREFRDCKRSLRCLQAMYFKCESSGQLILIKNVDVYMNPRTNGFMFVRPNELKKLNKLDEASGFEVKKINPQALQRVEASVTENAKAKAQELRSRNQYLLDAKGHLDGINKKIKDIRELEEAFMMGCADAVTQIPVLLIRRLDMFTKQEIVDFGAKGMSEKQATLVADLMRKHAQKQTEEFMMMEPEEFQMYCIRQVFDLCMIEEKYPGIDFTNPIFINRLVYKKLGELRKEREFMKRIVKKTQHIIDNLK